MEETNSMYISDNQQLLSAFKPGQFADFLRPLNNDYQKKEEDATMIEKDLPADHLTATYWG